MQNKKPAVKKIPNLEYTLRDVRTRFGTLIVDSINLSLHSDFYRGYGGHRGLGCKYVIHTTSHGIRGSQEGVFFDLALTPKQAKKIYSLLRQYFEGVE